MLDCPLDRATHVLKIIPLVVTAALLLACSSSGDDNNASGGGSVGTGGASSGTGAASSGTGGANSGGASSGGANSTVPSDFQQADIGGYKLGDPISINDAGVATSVPDSGTSGGMGSCGTKLLAVVRDFHPDGVNFEGNIEDDRGLMQSQLGTDQKPVPAQAGATATTSGPDALDQFYRSVTGVNDPYLLYLWFEANGAVWTFHSSAFFPLDDQGFGNEGNNHNYHFTTEVHTEFQYNGGETFTFVGDDDLWVFINGKLAIDLGGVHGAETDQIDLDAEAGTLGIQTGNIYPLDFFHAERHTTESNFRVDTNLAFVNCGTIVPDIR